ncbi:MAG: Rieske 2Fe-2S domain-containing protein [Acidimicrobiia bacterium]
MGFVEVANVTDLDDGQMVGFEADGTRILLAKVDGEFFAIGAICTHERANLDQGALLGHVVYCPLHYSAFDVRSGAVLGPPAECATPAHEVRVEDGKVLVALQPHGSEAPAPDAAANGAGASDVSEAASEPAAAAVAQAELEPEPVAAAAQAEPEPAAAAQPEPELVGAIHELVERVARLEQTVTELRGEVAQAQPASATRELAERVARLEQTERELRDELAEAKPSRAKPVGGDPWNHQAPQFMARIPTSVRYLPAAIAIPAGLVALLVLTAAVFLEDGPAIPDGDILFENFIGHGWLDIFTLSLVGVVAVLAATGLRRHWKGLHATLPPGIPLQPLGDALRGTAKDVVTQKDYDSWTTSQVRRKSHLAMFYGFMGLLAATTGAAIYTEIFPLLGIEWHENELSLPIWDPVKIVGNVGGIALLIGLGQTLAGHLGRPSDSGKSAYSEWFFPGLLGLTALSGFATEILRFAGVRLAYPAYAVHLVFVFALFVYFPFSKFSHVLYQPAALTFARRIRGKKPAPKVASTAPPIDSDKASV